MITKKLIFIPISIVVLFLSQNLPQNVNLSAKNRPAHKVKFFDEQSFNQGINKAKNTRPLKVRITGGIIPHHLFAGFLMADFFARLSSQKPSTIILLGPNHYEKGNFKALTSLYGWETPFGMVEPDETIIQSLIKRNLLRVDENTLPEDHAVAGSLPFIKYYIPKVKVVPILLSGSMNSEESEILADNLKEFVKKDAVIVAPVDFSHYLINKQAQQKDKITLQVMKDFDYRQLFLLNNDYLDSPPSIGTMLMVMQKLGKTHMDVLFNSNSGEIQKNDYIQTTSYFEIAY